MSAPKIPPQNPIGDSFESVLLRVNGQLLLSQAAPPELEPIQRGHFVVRYGVQYLQKPQSIVPGLIAVDYGEMLTGENAWDFLFKRSNLYPRADVIGYSDQGEEDMVPVKMLDLMRPVDVLVYESAEATQPLGLVRAIIAPEPDALPERLRTYAPIYPTVETWQKAP